MPQETHERDSHRSDAPPLGELYDVGGGRRLMLHHAGTGTPAVVIEAGAGAFGLDYLSIFSFVLNGRHVCCTTVPAAAGATQGNKACAALEEIVTDLHDALRLAGVSAPYLLVGHSFGGLLCGPSRSTSRMRLWAWCSSTRPLRVFRFPEEGEQARRGSDVGKTLRRNPDIMREWYPALFAEWEKLPAQVRDPLIARHMDPDYAIAGDARLEERATHPRMK